MAIAGFEGSLRLNEGLLLVDAQGKVAYVNTMMCRLLGLEKKACMGQPLDAIDRQPWGAGILKQIAAEARSRGAEVARDLAWKVGGKDRAAKVRAFVDGDRTHLLIEDVTQAAMIDTVLTRFVGPSLVDQLKASSLGAWKAERMAMTVLAATPSDFSRFAERLEPHVLREYLNDFVRRAVAVAKESNASVVKLSVPVVMLGFAGEAHARRAVEAARRLSAAGREMERGAALAGIGSVKLKFALNSGMTVVGPVGCPERMEYTMLGNAVDVVSTLLGNAMAGATLLTKAVKDELKDWSPEKCRLHDHGLQRLYGIDQPVQLMMLVED
jgi:class 3 adenylate cyclase